MPTARYHHCPDQWLMLSDAESGPGTTVNLGTVKVMPVHVPAITDRTSGIPLYGS